MAETTIAAKAEPMKAIFFEVLDFMGAAEGRRSADVGAEIEAKAGVTGAAGLGVGASVAEVLVDVSSGAVMRTGRDSAT